jgi:hypothetical protein
MRQVLLGVLIGVAIAKNLEKKLCLSIKKNSKKIFQKND